jgi:hypothetical protein
MMLLWRWLEEQRYKSQKITYLTTPHPSLKIRRGVSLIVYNKLPLISRDFLLLAIRHKR